MIISLLRQPLLHFLFVGALIFVLYDLNTAPVEQMVDDGGRIVVDRQSLLNYMQYRVNIFQPDQFAAEFDAMSEEERAELIREFVREEALYREAMALGMDLGDYNIRQRLVQKVEFLLENMVLADISPSDEELQAFYDERQENYRVDTVYTFTHIFFDSGQEGAAQAEARAREVLNASADIDFNDSSSYGDRYPFLQNYVGRTRDFVSNNFGAGFVDALDTLEVTEDRWQGPIASRYGMHLVMLRERNDPFVLGFEEIRDRVLDDYRYEALFRLREDAEARVISAYEVIVDIEADIP